MSLPRSQIDRSCSSVADLRSQISHTESSTLNQVFYENACIADSKNVASFRIPL